MKYEIEESHKYPGCFNVYDEKGNRICYFAEDDKLNKERAIKWIKSN